MKKMEKVKQPEQIALSSYREQIALSKPWNIFPIFFQALHYAHISINEKMELVILYESIFQRFRFKHAR